MDNNILTILVTLLLVVQGVMWYLLEKGKSDLFKTIQSVIALVAFKYMELEKRVLDLEKENIILKEKLSGK
jgi:uncharacterized membrane protein